MAGSTSNEEEGKRGWGGLQRQSLTILAEKSFQFVTICCSGLCKLAALVVAVTLKTFSLRLHFVHLVSGLQFICSAPVEEASVVQHLPKTVL